AFIVRIWKATRARKGNLAIVCPNDEVLEVIRLAGLDKVWSIHDEAGGALASMGVRGRAAAAAVAQANGDAAPASPAVATALMSTPPANEPGTSASTSWAIWLGVAGILLAGITLVAPLFTSLSIATLAPFYWAFAAIALIMGLVTVVTAGGHTRGAGLVVMIIGGLLLGIAGAGKMDLKQQLPNVPAQQDAKDDSNADDEAPATNSDATDSSPVDVSETSPPSTNTENASND
ncbi:MAG: hypothetical protein KDA58_16235, partial [Planctomycetaceae bacterium]|nr:hypothetical protein [Planctomycetaceae bacterium]